MKYNKIFIMTLPRSGSTILGQQLANHNHLFHLGESMYWEILDPKNTPCSCGKISCHFLDKVSKIIKEKHLALPLLKTWQLIDKKYWPEKKVSFADGFLKKSQKTNNHSSAYWLNSCPNALNKIINVYRKYSPKKVFIDNTKLFNIGEVLSSFNKWGIIVLLRDPRGIMSSYKNAGIRKKDGRKVKNILPFCRDFISSVKKISHLKNVCIIRYEDFCNNPHLTLQTLCDFIGVEFEESMIIPFDKKRKTKGHVLKGNRLLWLKKKIFLKIDNSWKSNLSKKELSDLYSKKTIIKLYRSFGYFLP